MHDEKIHEEYIEGQCGGCKHAAGAQFHDEDGEMLDYCQRFPPTFIGGSIEFPSSWQQPLVRCSDGCSEWAPLLMYANRRAV